MDEVEIRKEGIENSIEVTWTENLFHSDKMSADGCRPFEL